MKRFLTFLVGAVAIVAIIAAFWSIVGAVYYIGLPALGINISFGQSIVLATLIALTGLLFRGGNGNPNTKGRD
ncbi:hypothetical protein [Neobacillus mesonae]|uniref:Uncharacterized protein n=1 Tax=Neobacillus mesonae TaxID=1193713 RepID=A0A3T0HV49_9BACI|nr:hypothetical protein [Neobacillus mesonae]AZU61034.1 hypothetical protein CHR53_07080 [Neobacillus mesonae]